MADTINEINKLTDPPRMRFPTLNPKSILVKSILVITGIFSLFLIIAAAIPSSVKSNSYLVVGLFICFILKTIYDIIKIYDIKKLIKTIIDVNNGGNKFTKYIIPICAILYLVMFVIFFHMFYIILPNKESPCLSRILNLKIFAISLTFFIIGEGAAAYFLYSNKPEYYIISIALYTLMGMGLMLHYKKSVINLHNKLNDNCQEESVK